MSDPVSKAVKATRDRLRELEKSLRGPLARLLAKIREHFLDHDFDLTRIRREAGVSEWYVRTLSEHLGMTACDLILELRLEVLLRLLGGTPLSVAKLAPAIGYDTRRSVERLCRGRLGLKPTEVKARLRQVEPEQREGAYLLLSWYLYVRVYRRELDGLDLSGPILVLRTFLGEP